MDFFKRLDKFVKPELNLLYTVAPFRTTTGLDCGWFCREHAMHCFVICKMLKMECSIYRGDFYVQACGQIPVTSFGCDSDHAWCGLLDKCPVDLSMTFKLFGGGEVIAGPQLEKLVLGSGINGEYIITYTKDESEFRMQKDSSILSNRIHYLERQQVAFSINEIIDDPFIFLFRPREKGWVDVHGKGIFSKISMHLYKVFRGDVKPLFLTHNADSALRVIKTQYGGANQKIKTIAT